jgi:hypothetical protein
MFFPECFVSFETGKTVVIEVAQVLRIENRKIDIAIFENVLFEVVVGILLVLFVRPDVLFRTQFMIVVKAFDELFAVPILDILVAAIP